jgi:hypothetical protein
MGPLQQSLGLRLAALVASAFALSVALAQPPVQLAAYGLEPGELAVGFRLIEGQDVSRAVTAGNSSEMTHPRPLRVYLWYPAERAAQPMRFGRYAELADGDIWPAEIAGVQTQKLRYANRPLARSLGADGFAALLRQPVLAAENARPSKGPFPLVVLAPGLYYESPVAFAALAEYLAGRGFVGVDAAERHELASLENRRGGPRDAGPRPRAGRRTGARAAVREPDARRARVRRGRHGGADPDDAQR